LRSPGGADLPEVQAGSHIDVPIRLANGVTTSRRYSISSNPMRCDAYEIAILREDAGHGGSVAAHAALRLGVTLRCNLPGNDFPLHEHARQTHLRASVGQLHGVWPRIFRQEGPRSGWSDRRSRCPGIGLVMAMATLRAW